MANTAHIRISSGGREVMIEAIYSFFGDNTWNVTSSSGLTVGAARGGIWHRRRTSVELFEDSELVLVLDQTPFSALGVGFPFEAGLSGPAEIIEPEYEIVEWEVLRIS